MVQEKLQTEGGGGIFRVFQTHTQNFRLGLKNSDKWRNVSGWTDPDEARGRKKRGRKLRG